jgi:hypothetical protein
LRTRLGRFEAHVTGTAVAEARREFTPEARLTEKLVAFDRPVRTPEITVSAMWHRAWTPIRLIAG